MSINESQRQAYLEAMGIQPWFPRYILPGAKPSGQCEWPRAPAPVPPAAPPVPQGAAPAAEERREAPREAPRRDAAPHRPAQSPPSAAREDGEEDIRFRLAFIRAGDGLCILNQLPAAGPDRLSMRQSALLRNLLAAFRRDAEGLQFDEVPFRWPFVEGDHVAKGAGAARQALSVWLQQQTAHRPVGLVLLMGEAVAPCVTAESRGKIARGRLLEAAGGPWRVLVTRSLDEMLRLPALKRDVWRELQALARGGDA